MRAHSGPTSLVLDRLIRAGPIGIADTSTEIIKYILSIAKRVHSESHPDRLGGLKITAWELMYRDSSLLLVLQFTHHGDPYNNSCSKARG